MKVLVLGKRCGNRTVQHQAFRNRACWKCGVALCVSLNDTCQGSRTGLCMKCLRFGRIVCPECGKRQKMLGSGMCQCLKSLDRSAWVKVVKAAEFEVKV